MRSLLRNTWHAIWKLLSDTKEKEGKEDMEWSGQALWLHAIDGPF